MHFRHLEISTFTIGKLGILHSENRIHFTLVFKAKFNAFWSLWPKNHQFGLTIVSHFERSFRTLKILSFPKVLLASAAAYYLIPLGAHDHLLSIGLGLGLGPGLGLSGRLLSYTPAPSRTGS